MNEEELYLNILIAEAELQTAIGYTAFGMCVMLVVSLWIYWRVKEEIDEAQARDDYYMSLQDEEVA